MPALAYCLKRIFKDRDHRATDEIVDGLTFEELIGALLLAGDSLDLAENVMCNISRESNRLAVLDRLASDNHDGHYTVFRFTTHYKAMFGTPDLDSGAGRQQIKDSPGYNTLVEALDALIKPELELAEKKANR
jgi:hypothetical protein